ncbi:Abi family protein [Actinomyces gaoshouyii]|uniref:Abi family protein n=1 Tax=Actinomyces gaoshouyii TaxID=1960083 RepID=UPI0009BE204F|nr:hypothetical protein B6G06_07825 [Actinomyces gaoshouyii]
MLRPNRGVFSYGGAVPERPSQAYEKPPLNENQLLDRDRSLRLFVMDTLERVEVAVRASISNTMSLKAPGGAFWYLDPRNFDGEIRFSDSLSTISSRGRRAGTSSAPRDRHPSTRTHSSANVCIPFSCRSRRSCTPSARTQRGQSGCMPCSITPPSSL